MTSFFPDLNVWMALSAAPHSHSDHAWRWMNLLPRQSRFLFTRYTQLGLLRLLTNPSVMGTTTLTLRHAWSIYDKWLEDPRVQFYPEPRGLDDAFRQTAEPFAAQKASKLVGDCYLLAYAAQTGATLVTFDAGLHELARKRGYSAIIPS